MAKVTADEARLAAVILVTWCEGCGTCTACKKALKLEDCPFDYKTIIPASIPTLDDLATEKAEPEETLENTSDPMGRYQCPKCRCSRPAADWDKTTAEHYGPDPEPIASDDRSDCVYMCPACGRVVGGNEIAPEVEAVSDE